MPFQQRSRWHSSQSNQADLRHTSRYFAGQFSLFSAPMVMPGHMAMNDMEMVLPLNRRILNAILKNQIDRTSLKVVLVPRTGTVDQNMLEGSVGSIGSNGEFTLSATASKTRNPVLIECDFDG
jgi:hypothetical protein